ncbi:MAG TPA: hypothetical protein VKS44_04155 [Candidatus Acidoferrales bacterium]|nr:hypothetical protein [Candidatus Acidoferrales bacterium]
MIRRLFIVWALAFAAPAASWACACSQAPPGTCPHFDPGDVVFLGTVTQVAEVPTSAADAGNQSATATPVLRYHFHIDEKFSGPAASEIDVYSGGDDGDCGFRFKKGERYVVFTQQETERRLFATICNGTRAAADARALIPQLRSLRDGQRVASVFGVLRRADPPTLAPPDDPDDPLPNIPLGLRSRYDRFTATTGPDGVYSIYDVRAGEYQFTADLPPGVELTHRGTASGLDSFTIPNDACYEFNVDALPTGHIEGSVTGPDGKPLRLASLELFRAGTYDGSRSGLWTFQGAKGTFAFDHIGAGQYIIVYNRPNRMDPNDPFPRSFYPGVSDPSEAKPIEMKEGQLVKVKFELQNPYPTRVLRVHLKWTDGKPPGSVFVMAKADKGDNPAAKVVGDGVYDFTLLQSAHYTLSAWEQVVPPRPGAARGKTDCTLPARIDSDSLFVDGADATASDITLTFSGPECQPQNP